SRFASRSSAAARVRISRVFATPGTPSRSTCPRASSAITKPETTESWPTTALLTSARSRPSAARADAAPSDVVVTLPGDWLAGDWLPGDWVPGNWLPGDWLPGNWLAGDWIASLTGDLLYLLRSPPPSALRAASRLGRGPGHRLARGRTARGRP